MGSSSRPLHRQSVGLSVRDGRFRVGEMGPNDGDPTACYLFRHLDLMRRERTKAAVRWIRLGIWGGAALVAFESPGCGGIVLEGSRDQDGGTGGIDGVGGVSGSGPVDNVPPSTMQGGSAPAQRCGNGQIDPGEACDGTIFGGTTCGVVSMGTRPVGALRCTSSCVLDSSGCRSANVGAGGAIGAGGFTGAGGRSPETACYDANGVPSAAGGCAFGSAAQQLCVQRTNSSTSGSCSQSCACNACPSQYTRCMLDGACPWILSCTQQYACFNIQDCYKMGCSQMIDRAGGLGSVGARYADSVVACLSSTSCSCGVPSSR
jgi:hypothetical protein